MNNCLTKTPNPKTNQLFIAKSMQYKENINLGTQTLIVEEVIFILNQHQVALL